MKDNNQIAPPRWANNLFKLLCPHELFEELQGDLQQQFELDVKRVGVKAAERIYALETLKFAKPYFLKKRLLTLKKAKSQPPTANRQPPIVNRKKKADRRKPTTDSRNNHAPKLPHHRTSHPCTPQILHPHQRPRPRAGNELCDPYFLIRQLPFGFR